MSIETAGPHQSSQHAADSRFFVIGGTLSNDAPSYVERHADTTLYEALRRGEFCYVLTSRQMGKSSLMVRTAARLREVGCNAVVLDLTAIGQNLTADQWYDGLLQLIGTQLSLEDELEDFWFEHQRLSALQRWTMAVREIVLPRCLQSLIIFVDEIDAVRSLQFSTDEFFAAIRQFYNRRPEEPELCRLSFCLLGVAIPSHLIRDTRSTPFNIGTRIELTDFSLDEASLLEKGLLNTYGGGNSSNGNALGRVLYWTGGHPYLTQRLCQEVSDAHSEGRDGSVDNLCEEIFLSPKARERDDNLLFVREQILRSDVDTTSLLELYSRIRSRKRVRDDETNPLISVLRLSGIVRAFEGLLRIRNRIYEKVFDRRWIIANIPGAEHRRQRAAYRRGVLRTSAVAAVVLAVIILLSNSAITNARQSHQRLINLYISNWARLVEDGDYMASLPWVVEALKLDKGNPEQEKLHRIRIGTTLRQCPMIKRMWFHDGPVVWAEFSRDGKRVASASLDGTARVWNVETGAAVTPPLRHSNEVWHVSFSPDGLYVATASRDKTARVWDVKTGRSIAVLRHSDRVNRAIFSPDGTRVLTTCMGRTARLWDAMTGYASSIQLMHKDSITHAAFSRDGKYICTSSLDKTARVWDVKNGLPIGMALEHSQAVNWVNFSPSNGTVVTASSDGTARVWKVPTRRIIYQLVHQGSVMFADFDSSGVRVATAISDGSIRIWTLGHSSSNILSLRTKTNESPQLPPQVSNGIFSPDGSLFLSSHDNDAYAWYVESGKPAPPQMHHMDKLLHLAFSLDGNSIVTASKDKAVRVWKMAPGWLQDGEVSMFRNTRALRSVSNDQDYIVAISSDGGKIATSDGYRSTRLWNWKKRIPIGPLIEFDTLNAVFSANCNRIAIISKDKTCRILDTISATQVTPPLSEKSNYVRFSPDGTRVVTASTGESARVWDAVTGRPITPPLRHYGQVNSAVFSSDGSRIVTSANDGTARIWSATTGVPIGRRLRHRGEVKCAEFSRDGRHIVTASFDGTVRVWEANTGSPLSAVIRHGERVLTAIFDLNANRILTVSADKTARVWSAHTGKPLSAPLNHSNMYDANFDSSCSKVFTSSFEGTIRVWDSQSGLPLTPFFTHYGIPTITFFSSDGGRIISGTSIGRCFARDLSSDDRTEESLSNLSQLLSLHRVDNVGGLVPSEKNRLRLLWKNVEESQ